MTFAKPEKKSDHFDEDRLLYCQYPGCQRRWSVKIDKRLCSQHAWQDDKLSYPPPKPMAKLVEKLTDKPIPRNYYDTDEDF